MPSPKNDQGTASAKSIVVLCTVLIVFFQNDAAKISKRDHKI